MNYTIMRRLLSNNMMDPFRVLGISRNSTPEEAKTAYYKLVKEYHPDKNPSNAKKFKEIQFAYEKVKEFQKSGKYSTDNNTSTYSNTTRYGSSSTGSNPKNKYYEQTNFDPNRYQNWSSTSSTFKDAEDYIWFVKKSFESEFFKNSDNFKTSSSSTTSTTSSDNTYKHQQQPKIDIHRITLTFVESCLGCYKNISARTCFYCNGTGTKGYAEVICSECSGRGSVRVSQGPIHMVIPCPICHRYGRIKKTIICTNCDGIGHFVVPKQFQVKIPPGVNDGEYIDVTCDGSIQKVQIKVTPSTIFTRMANNIHSNVEIDYLQALMGDNIIVPTIHGDQCVKIPAGTSSHSTIRIPGKGINGNAHIIHIKIRVPHHTNNTTSGLISQLATLRGFGNLTWNSSNDNPTSTSKSYALNYLKDSIILFFEKIGFNVKFLINLYNKIFKNG